MQWSKAQIIPKIPRKDKKWFMQLSLHMTWLARKDKKAPGSDGKSGLKCQFVTASFYIIISKYHLSHKNEITICDWNKKDDFIKFNDIDCIDNIHPTNKPTYCLAEFKDSQIGNLYVQG